MVSLISRAGLLDEAEQLIMESTYLGEHLELWRILLSSCVDKRNLRIGVRAAEQVLRLDPEDGPTYVLLSNLYAAARRWDCVAEMRRKIRELRLEKDPGISWIDARNGIHVFSSGEQSNLIVDEAQTEVLWLRGNMTKSVAEDFDARIYTTQDV
uniref:Uncharacterized protein n=1 Tax=Rhizophora mucronata TaxID=61149 RepID=A0A2P2IL98_RHIMU